MARDVPDSNTLSSLLIYPELCNTADPADGDGVFLTAAIDRLYKSSLKFGFDFARALTNLKTVEIDSDRVETIQRNLTNKINGLGFKENVERLVTKGDFLTSDLQRFDIVIGNPPYIRHEKIPERTKILYRKLFQLFRHRSDLYVAFFEKSLSLLSEGGRLCFICPDRWLRIRYGGPLRDHLSENYDVPVIVNLNEADVFEEKVYGYPMIILVDSSQKNGFIQYFEIKNPSDLALI